MSFNAVMASFEPEREQVAELWKVCPALKSEEEFPFTSSSLMAFRIAAKSQERSFASGSPAPLRSGSAVSSPSLVSLHFIDLPCVSQSKTCFVFMNVTCVTLEPLYRAVVKT